MDSNCLLKYSLGLHVYKYNILVQIYVQSNILKGSSQIQFSKDTAAFLSRCSPQRAVEVSGSLSAFENSYQRIHSLVYIKGIFGIETRVFSGSFVWWLLKCKY